MLNRRTALCAVAAIGAVASGVPAMAQAPQFVRIGSGLAGTYPVFAAKMAEIINREVPGTRASTMPGPTEQNLVRVQRGEAEMVLSYTFQSYDVAQGRGELRVPTPDVRHIMSTYGAYHWAIVRRGLDIQSLADLKTRPLRVWLGPRASVFWPMNIAALGAYGVAPEDISRAGGVVNSAGYQNLTQMFQDGQVDVAFFSGPASYSLLLQLDRSPGFRMLPFDEAAGRRYQELLPGAGIQTLPTGIYQSVTQPTPSPYVFNHIVASTRMSDEIAYRITKALVEKHREFHGLFPGAEEVSPQRALDFNRIPVHPGAMRYYREAGLAR